MSLSKKTILRALEKKGVMNKVQYEVNSEYQKYFDELCDKINKLCSSSALTPFEQEQNCEKFVDDYGNILFSLGGNSDKAFEFSELILKLKTQTPNWDFCDLLLIKLRLSSSEGILQKTFRNSLKDKSLLTLILYIAFSLTLTPIASFFVSSFNNFFELDFIKQHQFLSLQLSQIMSDAFSFLIVFTIVFPFILTNIIIKTSRRPTVKPHLLPIIIILGFVIFIEYTGFIKYFDLNIQNFCVLDILKFSFLAIKERWYLVFSLFVIWGNILIQTSFIDTKNF